MSPTERTQIPARTIIVLTSNDGCIYHQLVSISFVDAIQCTPLGHHPPRTQQIRYALRVHRPARPWYAASMPLSETPLQHTTQPSQLSDTLRYIIGDFEVLVDDWEQAWAEVVHGLGCVD